MDLTSTKSASSGSAAVGILIALAIGLAACTSTTDAEDGVAGAQITSTTIEDYPDLITRELQRQMRAARPVPNSALPPRHLDDVRFPDILVERSLIVSGGPPPDGIRSIDEPVWRTAGDIDWLADEESVLVLTGERSIQIYPTQIMLWHEIVNAEIDGRPITVTYCPLCNSAVAFDRRLDGEVLDFGTSGALYHSALVMYDRQTESLWTHFDGRSVVGDFMGAELEVVPVQTLSWSDAAARWPDAMVLDRPTGELGQRPYGTSPYPNYDAIDEALPGFFQGSADPRLPEKHRVVGVVGENETVAVDRALIEQQTPLEITLDKQLVRLEHRPGVRSALDGRLVAEGNDIGAIAAVIVNSDGSTDPIGVLDTFWFAWSSYYPETKVVSLEVVTADQ